MILRLYALRLALTFLVAAPAVTFTTTAAAVEAIDRTPVLTDVSRVYDGDTCPIGLTPDMGADEFGGGSAIPPRLRIT